MDVRMEVESDMENAHKKVQEDPVLKETLRQCPIESMGVLEDQGSQRSRS